MGRKSSGVHPAKAKRKHRGVHAKTKSSKSKNADNYVKKYKGQGRG